MSYLAQYKKEDFKKMSWEDYGKILENLGEKVEDYVKQNNIKIDVVVPILRGGAFPGAFLAYKLGLLRIVPVQYKYFFTDGKIELRKILGFPKESLVLPVKPVFLLVEGNHCFGLTGTTAAKDLKTEFPDSKIIYAADTMDYGYKKNDFADAIFYGKLTNETRVLTPEQCGEKGIENISNIFPWEDIEEEWTTVQGKQFEYGDLEKAKQGSQIKEIVKNN